MSIRVPWSKLSWQQTLWSVHQGHRRRGHQQVKSRASCPASAATASASGRTKSVSNCEQWDTALLAGSKATSLKTVLRVDSATQTQVASKKEGALTDDDPSTHAVIKSQTGSGLWRFKTLLSRNLRSRRHP